MERAPLPTKERPEFDHGLVHVVRGGKSSTGTGFSMYHPTDVLYFLIRLSTTLFKLSN